MEQHVRSAVIPFVMLLVPAVWYINRNVTTERLPPYTEPTAGLVAGALGLAVFGSLLFAAVVVAFVGPRRSEDEPHELPYRRRVFRPDDTALVVFAGFILVSLVWALIGLAGFGPGWLGEPLQILLSPLALPLLVLAPLAIQFHWAVLLGLVLCVLWMSLLATVISDLVHRRSLPLIAP